MIKPILSSDNPRYWDPVKGPWNNGVSPTRAILLKTPDHEKKETAPRMVDVLKHDHRVVVGQVYQGEQYEVFSDLGPCRQYYWIAEHFESGTRGEFYSRSAAEHSVRIQG